MRQRIVGAGITQKRITTLVEVTARGVREDPGLAKSKSFGGFAQFANDVREWAGRTLEAAGLPSQEGHYVQVKDGSFYDVSAASYEAVFQMELRCARGLDHPIGMNIEAVVKEAGFEFDAPEGYAATLLGCLDRAERSRVAGRVDSAMEWSLRLGEAAAEARIKLKWESHALRGQKNDERLAQSRDKPNADRHDESTDEWRRWQDKADELTAKYPNYKKYRIAGKVRGWLVEQRAAQEEEQKSAQQRGEPYPDSMLVKVRSEDAIARRITIDRMA